MLFRSLADSGAFRARCLQWHGASISRSACAGVTLSTCVVPLGKRALLPTGFATAMAPSARPLFFFSNFSSSSAFFFASSSSLFFFVVQKCLIYRVHPFVSFNIVPTTKYPCHLGGIFWIYRFLDMANFKSIRMVRI